MKKKNYQRPTMMVFRLMQQQHLLQTSNLRATRNGYGTANEDEWE